MGQIIQEIVFKRTADIYLYYGPMMMTFLLLCTVIVVGIVLFGYFLPYVIAFNLPIAEL